MNVDNSNNEEFSSIYSESFPFLSEYHGYRVGYRYPTCWIYMSNVLELYIQCAGSIDRTRRMTIFLA